MGLCNICDRPNGIEHFVMVSDALDLGDTEVWELEICAECRGTISAELSRLIGKEPALHDLEPQEDSSQ